ncbi:MAG: pirin family protein [Candidatus Contendobacter sp.]
MNKDPHSESSYVSDAGPSIETSGSQRLSARKAEIGSGLTVARLLPSRTRRTIGAWCFLDHVGPARFAPGGGLRVGPHPHIGLQTFTWMIEGEVLHRDSLGNEQVIRPSQVNLMTAGRGIAHTEESTAEATRAHAAQLWIALPAEQAEREPAFDHYPDLPRWEESGCTLTLLVGAHAGRSAPTQIYTPLVGLEVWAEQATVLSTPLDPAFEYGLLPLEGAAELEGETFSADELAYLARGRAVLRLQLAARTRALLIGGVPFGDNITIWWNFVGHNRATIAQAQRDWEAERPRFGAIRGFAGLRMKAPEIPWLTS